MRQLKQKLKKNQSNHLVIESKVQDQVELLKSRMDYIKDLDKINQISGGQNNRMNNFIKQKAQRLINQTGMIQSNFGVDVINAGAKLQQEVLEDKITKARKNKVTRIQNGEAARLNTDYVPDQLLKGLQPQGAQRGEPQTGQVNLQKFLKQLQNLKPQNEDQKQEDLSDSEEDKEEKEFEQEEAKKAKEANKLARKAKIQARKSAKTVLEVQKQQDKVHEIEQKGFDVSVSQMQSLKDQQKAFGNKADLNKIFHNIRFKNIDSLFEDEQDPDKLLKMINEPIQFMSQPVNKGLVTKAQIVNYLKVNKFINDNQEENKQILANILLQQDQEEKEEEEKGDDEISNLETAASTVIQDIDTQDMAKMSTISFADILKTSSKDMQFMPVGLDSVTNPSQIVIGNQAVVIDELIGFIRSQGVKDKNLTQVQIKQIQTLHKLLAKGGYQKTTQDGFILEFITDEDQRKFFEKKQQENKDKIKAVRQQKAAEAKTAKQQAKLIASGQTQLKLGKPVVKAEEESQMGELD